KTITEITCHGRGAYRLFEQPSMTVIDIGGQDTKIMDVEDGNVRDFLMNDKCSAGTGRFLEVMATALGLSIDQLCDMASRGSDTSISSMCTVFAESEVISLIGKGESRENIAFAIVDSIVQKVAAQAGRLSGSGDKVFLTGGLCDCPYVVSALSRVLGKPVATCPEARFAGAIGAAVSASKLK
ncbi:MAG: CoA activase, partial [Firmicutes bacterium]|nr:CoA activase [Bacillota bacterium]